MICHYICGCLFQCSVVLVMLVCGVCVLFFLTPLQHFDLVLEVGVVQLFLLHTFQGIEVPGISLSHQVNLRKRAPADTQLEGNAHFNHINNNRILFAICSEYRPPSKQTISSVHGDQH